MNSAPTDSLRSFKTGCGVRTPQRRLSLRSTTSVGMPCAASTRRARSIVRRRERPRSRDHNRDQRHECRQPRRRQEGPAKDRDRLQTVSRHSALERRRFKEARQVLARKVETEFGKEELNDHDTSDHTSGGCQMRLKMSDVLMPPKAKLLLWTNSASIRRSVPVM